MVTFTTLQTPLVYNVNEFPTAHFLDILCAIKRDLVFQEDFSGVMNPISQEVQNELHRQRPAELKQWMLVGLPQWGSRRHCLGSEYGTSAVQTATGSNHSSKNWQWHTEAVVHI